MCTWFMGSQDEEGRCGAVTRGRLLAHMSKPKGRAACLRTHLGPIRNTHARTSLKEMHMHAHTLVEWKCPSVSGGKRRLAECQWKTFGVPHRAEATGWFVEFLLSIC